MINEEFVIGVEEATEEQLKEALLLLAKKKERQAKIARGEIKGGTSWSDKTEEQKQTMREYNRRRQMKIKLLADKALASGITVSDDEVEAALSA